MTGGAPFGVLFRRRVALPLRVIVLRDLLHRTSADRRGVVRLGGKRLWLAGLDEQPFVTAFLAPILHQNPLTLQLFAAQNDVHLALVESRGRIAGEVFVFALIPDHHCARAVVAGRDGALEACVFEGMIFDVHGEPRFPQFRRRTFRHCPGTEHALHLQPPVVVQVTGLVLLNDEAVNAFACRTVSRRFRRFGVVSLRCILAQTLVVILARLVAVTRPRRKLRRRPGR